MVGRQSSMRFNDGVIGQVGLGRIADGAGILFYGEYVRNVAAFES